MMKQDDRTNETLAKQNLVLRRALKSAYEVMNYFGDVLNGMDCIAEVAEETGVPTRWVERRFATVRKALGEDE